MSLLIVPPEKCVSDVKNVKLCVKEGGGLHNYDFVSYAPRLLVQHQREVNALKCYLTRTDLCTSSSSPTRSFSASPSSEMRESGEKIRCEGKASGNT